MSISYPSLSSLSYCLSNPRSKEPTRMVQFPLSLRPNSTPKNRSFPRFTISSHLNSSNSSKPHEPNHDNELFHKLPQPRRRKGKGAPVFVTLPVDVLDSGGEMKRKKSMTFSLLALALAGVEGIVMELWWGLVEKEPEKYNWCGYLDVVKLAQNFGLKIRAVMAFHEFGVPGDACWIPLPYWARKEMVRDPDLAYADRFGRRSMEYISLGCDTIPVLNGRSPIQAYSDFMRSFKDTFENFLGYLITGIQVGMGPAGELRYPSCPSKKLTSSWRFRELGEFQCYDKYMLASLNASAGEIGLHKWGKGGPPGNGKLIQNPEEVEFFRSLGSWNTPRGEFFLKWYSGMLLLHGERLCTAAESIFGDTGVNISAKLAAQHWHYDTNSHPSELTAGYYNTSIRDGYLPLACMFARHGVTLCCSCFEMQDKDEKLISPLSSPEGWLRRVLLAARACDLPIDGEISSEMSDESLNQVLKMSKSYSGGLDESSFTFNFVRMNPNFFGPQNWVRVTEFVKQMSPGDTLLSGNVNGKIFISQPSKSSMLASSSFTCSQVFALITCLTAGLLQHP